VGVAFFGDGAVNNGAFHEGINLATIWKLPVIFVCENNLYATEVPFAAASGNPDVGNRGPAYGLPSVIVDGNDILAVFDAAGEAVRRARSGEGPTLIEAKTYRTRAHSEGMRDTGYRTQAEVDGWKARDPITTYRARLLDESLAAEDDLQEIEADVQGIVTHAAEFAAASPWPDPATAAAHVYHEAEAAQAVAEAAHA
jgi:2-oxoisovalerate dehydrogenase E1 component